MYSGSFDPVHVGHIAFALGALKAARLDYVYFLPECEPRRKTGVTHFGHRVAMLKRALKPHTKLGILELTQRRFTVLKSLPEIRAYTGTATLVFLVGSDVALHMPNWPYVASLLRGNEVCVGLRSRVSKKHVLRALERTGLDDTKVHVFTPFAAQVSSSQIRTSIRARQKMYGVLLSVYSYAKQEWLYL